MKTMSKRISAYALAFLMVLGVLLPNMVSAQENITELTVDSENFTIIAEKKGQEITVPVYGLTSDYKKAPITTKDFTTSYSKANFKVDNVEELQTKEGKTAGIKVLVNKKTDGVIQLKYTKDPSKVLPINVYFDKKQDPASNITVTIKGLPQEYKYTLNSVVAKNYKGSFGEDTLKNAPTALGALDQTGKENVVVKNGFLHSIDGLEGKWDASTSTWKGWHYTVNGKEPQMGAGVYRLSNNDKVEFVYK